MLHRGYADHYARFLEPYVHNRDKDRIVLCEVGVLKGTGLAIWCDLFPNSRVIGLDFDLSSFYRNEENLRKIGAFGTNYPELYEYDQFVYCAKYLEDILDGDRIDIFVDDGNHSDESILTTLDSASPHLAEKFVYFIEDNQWIYRKIQSNYEQFVIFNDVAMSVLTSVGDYRVD
ncbi:MAG: hypothetical protein OXI60_00925 [Acidiferrobacterales bacterium]|nr:hypothetical protein [Acidiferrobacterales bacterium]